MVADPAWRGASYGSIGGRDVTGSSALIENSTDVLQNLKQILKIRPKAARFFGVRLDTTNHPARQDIFWLAQERVLVKVRLHQRVPTTLLRR